MYQIFAQIRNQNIRKLQLVGEFVREKLHEPSWEMFKQ